MDLLLEDGRKDMPLRVDAEYAARACLAAQSALTLCLARAGALRSTAPAILRSLGENLGWEAGELRVRDAQRKSSVVSAFWRTPAFVPAFNAACRRAGLAHRSPLFARLRDFGGPVWITDAEACGDPALSSLARGYGLRSVVGFPIRCGTRFLGSLHLFSRDLRTPDKDMLAFASSAGLQIGQFIRFKRRERNSTALNGARKQLVANLVHDIRTPVTAIKGFAESLRCGALGDPKQSLEFVRTIERNTDRIAALAEELQGLWSNEHGLRKPAPQPIDLGELARTCAACMSPLARGKKLLMSVRMPEGVTVMADRQHLRRVLQNLMENAIKYNRCGGWISVGCSIEPAEAVVEVKDGGIGIPQRELPMIFKRFRRGQRALEGGYAGTGLGLAIVKQLVEANGGRIWAESKPGSGSTFRFSLPLAR